MSNIVISRRQLIASLIASVVVLSLVALVVGLAVGLTTTSSSSNTPTDRTTSTDAPTTGLPSSSSPNPSSDGSYRYMAVTSQTQVCSQIGTDILLRLRGSAVDAAIATMLCVGAVNVHSNGIGGGHFSTIYERPRGKTDRVMKVVIGRERAPGFATRDMFVNSSASSLIGGKAIAVPGEIRGFHEAWKEFGRVDWSTLFLPTIRLLEEGYQVGRSLAGYIKQYENQIRNDSNFRELFVKSDGTLIQEGDVLINKNLATTFRRLAADPDTFYNGSLAQDIVDDIKEYGGNITLEDLISYRSITKDPINVRLSNGNYTLYNPPPPAGGVILDFIMSVLDGYNFTEADDVSSSDRKTLTYHRIVEAFKFAYAKRSRLGDMDFVNLTELVYNLTSPDFANSIRLQIDDNRTRDVFFYQPDFANAEDHGTTHINVLAPDGSAVAMTSTINYLFGALVRGNRTGILFNDQMDDFSTPGSVNVFGFPPSPNNFIVPGKIPQSSMCPTIVLDSNSNVAFMDGAAGGSRITTTSAFTMIGSLWFNQDLKTALDTGRIHHQLVPNHIAYEPWLDDSTLSGLQAKGHNVSRTNRIAIVNAIRNTCPRNVATVGRSNMTSCVHAVVDGRQGGRPDGV